MRDWRKRLRPHAENVIARVGPHRWPTIEPRLWVLMYHRVLPEEDPRYQAEEPGMVVTPQTLRNHIRWLREEFALVRLGQWVELARVSGRLPRRAVALTFDDGWRDNLEYGLPVLVAENAPATLFISTDFIGTNRTFWPNRLSRVLRDRRIHSCSSETAQWLRERLTRSGDLSRGEIAVAISRAKSFPEEEICARLDDLERAWMLTEDERTLLTWPEVREMFNSGCVDIGSHSCSHLRLRSGVSRERLHCEIVESKERIERELGAKVSVFCYPNGDYSGEAETVVREHYRAAVTTKKGSNTGRTCPWRLKRIPLHEDVARRKSGLFGRLGGL